MSRGRSPAERHALSEEIRASNDVAFYRHFHGPLYYYWLILTSHLTKGAWGNRAFSLVFPVLSSIAIYFGCLWLAPGGAPAWAALATALFLWSSVTVSTLEVAPHQMFALWSLLGLILLAKAVETGRRKYFYLACVMAGLACSTLEVGCVLVAVTLTCAAAERATLKPDWRFGLRSLALFAATVLVTWPSALFKLSFVKAYLSLAYLSVFRKSAWGNVGGFETWQGRFLWSPVEWTLILLAIGLYLSGGWRAERVLYPFFLFGVLMVALTAGVHSETPRYSLVFLPALEVFAGGALGAWLARRSGRAVRGTASRAAYGATAILCAALFASTWLVLARRKSAYDPRPQAVLDVIRAHSLEKSTLLVPVAYGPLIHLNYPQAYLRFYDGPAPAGGDLEGKKFDGVVYAVYPPRYETLAIGR